MTCGTTTIPFLGGVGMVLHLINITVIITTIVTNDIITIIAVIVINDIIILPPRRRASWYLAPGSVVASYRKTIRQHLWRMHCGYRRYYHEDFFCALAAAAAWPAWFLPYMIH